MSRPLSGHPDDVIELWTKNGPCEIHLLSGDITQLTVEQKMDIIMVSAFPSDYAAMRSTLIGALKHNLGIDVGKLSLDKELDLRHHFSCWLSKPIETEGTPFKKILCFEKRRSEMPVATQISDMFRVFTPVFNNQDHTVITPLLATGHQGSNRALICKTMVDAAAHWITAGLPLRCLKVVSYEEISDEIRKSFQKLKAKYLAKNEKLKRRIFSKKYDVYISYSPGDQDYVKNILLSLKNEKSDVKVYSEVAKYNKEKVWQDQIFKTMVASRRIIAVLSLSFLENTECLEQYNIAMCCNRLMGIDVLAPFYVESISSLPTYMGLVQWIDCRVRRDGETSEMKIQEACSTVLKAIEGQGTVQPGTGDAKGVLEDKFSYDVFISYSHKNPDKAEALLKTFKTFNEDLKVFYDRSSLTTGSNWQHMLYRSLGECRCVIALLSPDYLSSQMCMEEYSLALARYLSGDKGITFIPLCAEKIDSIPSHLSKVSILDASDDFGIAATKTTEMVCRWLEKQPTSGKPQTKENIELIERIFCESRTKMVRKQYWVVTNKTNTTSFERIEPLVFEKPENPSTNSSTVDLALVYANDSMHMAGTLCSVLDTIYPGLNISVKTQGDHKRMEALDKAKQIVIFVSQELLSTEVQMQELHLALCRQRQSSTRILYLIKTTKLQGRPFFPRILPFDIACTDPVWDKFEEQYLKGKVPTKKTIIHRKSDRMQHSSNFVCTNGEFYAVTKAAEDILKALLHPSEDLQEVPPILQNVVACDIDLHGEITVDVPDSLPTKDEQAKKEEQKHAETILEESEADLKEENQDAKEDAATGGNKQEKNTSRDIKRVDHQPKQLGDHEKSDKVGNSGQTGDNSSKPHPGKGDILITIVERDDGTAASNTTEDSNGIVEKNTSAKQGQSKTQQKHSSTCTVL